MNVIRSSMGNTFNIVLLGDDKVGKTSLVQRYIKKNFSETYKKTLGLIFIIYMFNVMI